MKALLPYLPLPLLLAFASGCHRSQPPAGSGPPPLPSADVRVQTVSAEKSVATEEVVGTVRARLRATLEAKVSGRIESLPVTLGQAVKAGDLLVQLDVREGRARLDQAVALRQQATRELERFKALLQQKAVTQSEFDAVEARSRVAEAAVVEAETILDYSRVVAPFAGIITRRLADVGDLASPGRSLLEIEDPTAFRLEADVPEATIGRLKIGERLQVQIPALAREFEGVVVEIAPSADPISRTSRVKLDLPTSPDLRSGQFGRLTVPLGETQTLWVPTNAVVRRGQMELVFVAINHLAHMRLVKTGKRTPQGVELLSGVVPGETVVVDGAANLRDGQPIQVR